jgi:hypothetical protein
MSSGIGITYSKDVYMISNHGEQWDKVESVQPDRSLRIDWNNFEDSTGKTTKEVFVYHFFIFVCLLIRESSLALLAVLAACTTLTTYSRRARRSLPIRISVLTLSSIGRQYTRTRYDQCDSVCILTSR